MSISVPEKNNKKTSTVVEGRIVPIEKKENFIQYFTLVLRK